MCLSSAKMGTARMFSLSAVVWKHLPAPDATAQDTGDLSWVDQVRLGLHGVRVNVGRADTKVYSGLVGRTEIGVEQVLR